MFMFLCVVALYIWILVITIFGIMKEGELDRLGEAVKRIEERMKKRD